MSTQERIEKMLKLSEHIIAAGGEKKVAKQHASGKLTARERIALLLDEGSFVELDRFVSHRCTNFGQDKKELPGEGVTTGYGTVDGRLVYVFAQDFTVEGGSLGEMHANKIVKVQRLALKMGAPCVGLNDSGGARIQEAVDALGGYGKIFYFQPGHETNGSFYNPYVRRIIQNAVRWCYHGSFRWRRCIQPGSDRLHLHGKEHFQNVHYRPCSC